MKIYALIQYDTVWEIIPPLTYDTPWQAGFPLPPWEVGDEVPIERRFADEVVNGPVGYVVDITDLNPRPELRWQAFRDEDGNWSFDVPIGPRAE